MFFTTKKSVIDEIKKEDAQLARILRIINELYRKSNFKLAYINNLLKNHNLRRFYNYKIESKEFLHSNHQILEFLEELIRSEKEIETDEAYRKQIFKKEIENIQEALNLLKKIKEYVERENKLFKYLQELGECVTFDKRKESLKIYQTLALVGECVIKEIKLLEIESSKITIVEEELKRLNQRIKNNRKMPIVKSKYYHASSFIFNVGDVVQASGPRRRFMEIENLFEEVRKKEFPDRPSRFNCIYVSDNPRTIEYLGLVYAVEIKGTIFKTSQDTFREATDKNVDDETIIDVIRDYWEGNKHHDCEILVNGEVVIIGLAEDYVKKGDKIEIMIPNLEDDEGKPVPKGIKGEIIYYSEFNEDVLFVAIMENGCRISLPANSFKVIK